MCTVSFVKIHHTVVLTSNRDEAIHRGTTLPPTTYVGAIGTIVYPKDEKGTGTWIGCNSFNNMAVMLNGAFHKHIPQPPYKHSRGLIIPTILNFYDSCEALEQYNLTGIEPFTLIIFQQNNLFEYRWDAIKLHQTQLDTNQIHLWNSVTLYDSTIEKNNLMQLKHRLHNQLSNQPIWEYHFDKLYQKQLPQHSIANNIVTVSITQLVLQHNRIGLHYHDFIDTTNVPLLTHYH